MRKRLTFTRLMGLISVLILAAGFAGSQLRADAGPANGAEQYRVAAITSDGHIQKSVLLAQGSRTMGTTPVVNGSTVCVDGDAKQFAAQLTLSGTLGGTAPTLTVVLQHSIDGGTTWYTVNSFTAINATVTPAAQLVSFSDVPASTAVTFGDCFRMTWTYGGSGTVTANFGGRLIAK